MWVIRGQELEGKGRANMEGMRDDSDMSSLCFERS